jgi:hypothetical protein
MLFMISFTEDQAVAGNWKILVKKSGSGGINIAGSNLLIVRSLVLRCTFSILGLGSALEQNKWLH